MSQRPKVVACRDLGKDVMPLLQSRDDIDLVLWPEDRACSRSWLLENIPGASAVLVMLSDQVNTELLDKAGSSLKIVSTMSVGYEHVDTTALASRSIRLGYTPDVLTDAVADLSIMLALMAGRNGGEAISLVQNNQWPSLGWAPFGNCGPQLSTSPTPTPQTRTAGFIGMGRIARATLARLIPFGFTRVVYASNPSSSNNADRDASLFSAFPTLKEVKCVPLELVARESDVVFVLAPGGPRTRHIVNEAFLKEMKRTAVLVNTSRGTLVNSDALAYALKEGWLWAAGLDVVEGEPDVLADHPLVKEPRCVVLPHIGSATLETRLGMATLAANNLLAGLDGTPMPAEVELK